MAQNSPQELIDRVSSNTGLHLPALAERLGLKPRSLSRIRSGENELSEPIRLHLQDLEKLYADAPKHGKVTQQHAGDKRVNRTTEDEDGEYARKNVEGLQLILARVTARFSVPELAELISAIADDQDLPLGLRNRVVKIISELIPQRMK